MGAVISQSVWSIFKTTYRHHAFDITVQHASDEQIFASTPSGKHLEDKLTSAPNPIPIDEAQLPPVTFPETFRLPDLLSIINPIFHYGVSKHQAAAMEAAGQWCRRY
jgi:hypothetical protein